jgi:hypothetical protein
VKNKIKISKCNKLSKKKQNIKKNKKNIEVNKIEDQILSVQEKYFCIRLCVPWSNSI